MNIHEYQAKALFEKYGVATPKGYAARSYAEFDSALSHLPDKQLVVKAQIHAGGRGKGTFRDGYRGGVKLVSSKAEAKEVGARMLGNTILTAQTGPAGRLVQTVYFTETIGIEKEYYLAILMDRGTSRPILVASTEGGVEIEEVAKRSPEKIVKAPIDPFLGLRPFQAREVASSLGLRGDRAAHAAKLMVSLYRMFWECDCSMVEINPLISTPEGRILALDAKVSFDDNALFRHPDLQALRDLNEEDPKEVEASKFNLSYIALDGNIACLVNGAGLAMATMDIIQHYGGSPANFLDVGGGASVEQVTAAFRIILSDKNVKGILVNIFGGIMKCDVVANGILAAARATHLAVPLVVRLEGTNVALGKEILATSGLAIHSADSLAEAAQKIVGLVRAHPHDLVGL